MNTIASSISRKLWSPKSYTQYKRYIDYFSPEDNVFQYISKLPPIVSTRKIDLLKKNLMECQNNQRILFHAGDCAEPFEHVDHEILDNKVKFFNTCRSLISGLSNKKTLLLGRIAGQYAKPRSSQFTMHNGVTIHNYKGDNVNSQQVTSRQPQHSKLCQGYFNSIATHNYLMQQMQEMFVSHQGLILPYEAAQAKQSKGKYYCRTAHMLWIGERTRQLDGAHIQFFRGIQNPIGIKISAKIDQKQFVQLVKTLNPLNQKGKMLVIIRMGKDKVNQKLQSLIECKQRQKLNFLFVSDPMHANTYQSQHSHQLKTRNYSHIYQQISNLEKLMKKHNLTSGLSLESTFEDVFECFGGAYPFEEHQITPERYTTKCDPRLNWNQTLKLLNQIYGKK